MLEILTALVLTLAASEYLHGSRRRALVCALTVGVANALAAAHAAITRWSAIILTVKVPLTAILYLVTCYWDTVVCNEQLSRAAFWAELHAAFVRLLPLFPLFSLLIAFLFLEVGTVFERMGWPTIWLNGPIHYGVLYGPFAYIYVRVKAVAKASTPLP
uniref:Uncharacterized protein n=1 Tax=Calcidiscus leptoporus TaxID=127549 RepID=A0A6U5DD88_9EUKA|mmetsp:Transcript_13536/g.31104  ORF Transcript_13536/g.31104 Transcript_13536/m.31104 type:complete len:159 (+) Transcript_13536:128-604(+)